MEYLKEKFSIMGSKPNPEKCCEKCVYNRCKHADWCPHKPRGITSQLDHVYADEQGKRVLAAARKLMWPERSK